MLLHIYKVYGSSMAPRLKPGQYVLASSIPFLFCAPRVGDMVIVNSSSQKRLIVKRIAKKRNDKYYVIGDNPNASTDSRKFGWIERDVIAAKVLLANY